MTAPLPTLPSNVAFTVTKDGVLCIPHTCVIGKCPVPCWKFSRSDSEPPTPVTPLDVDMDRRTRMNIARAKLLKLRLNRRDKRIREDEANVEESRLVNVPSLARKLRGPRD